MSGVKLESAPETRFSGWVFLDIPGKGVHTKCPRGTCSPGSPSGLHIALTSHFMAEQTETQEMEQNPGEQSECPHAGHPFFLGVS